MANIAIVGLGTLGGMFASLYADEGHNVTVLCDGERRERYLKRGFTVNGKQLKCTYKNPDEAEKPDFILVAVKYGALHQAADLIRPVLKDDTIILSVLNGIDSEEVLARDLGLPPLMICHSAGTTSYKIPDGTGITFDNAGVFMYGEPDGSESERFLRLKELLKSSKFPNYLKASTTIRRDSWWKFMLNVGTSQISAVLTAGFGDMCSNEYIRNISVSAMKEVVALSRKLGTGLTEEDIYSSLDTLIPLPPHGSPSMNQDMLAKRKTEVEMFGKRVCDMGAELGIPTPTNWMLYNLIRAKEVMNGL